MSDAKYGIVKSPFKNGLDSVILVEHAESNWSWIPTYTVSELLYKLHEWIYPVIDGKEFSGPLTFLKDAPFYIFYYRLTTEDYDPLKPSGEQKEEWNEGQNPFAVDESEVIGVFVAFQRDDQDIGQKEDENREKVRP